MAATFWVVLGWASYVALSGDLDKGIKIAGMALLIQVLRRLQHLEMQETTTTTTTGTK